MNNKIVGGIGSVLCILLVILGVSARIAKVVIRHSERSTQGLSASDRKHLKKMENIKKDALASPERDKPFLERRASFQTKLNRQGKSPNDWEPEPLIEGLELVTYESNGMKLKAALYVPPDLGNEKRPALVYYHGGFALYYGSIEVCQPFIDNDFIIMMPMMRGENGGEGNYELFVGELDDAANAIRWLSRHKNVDADHIYAFGHSIGGGISAMMSLMDKNLPLKHCGSSGGLYGPYLFYAWLHADSDGPDVIRFNPENVNESLMRVLYGNVKWMNRKHYAYIGTQDEAFLDAIADMRLENAAAPDKTRLNIAQPGGDHMSSLKPAIKLYHAVVMADIKRAGISDEAVSASVAVRSPSTPQTQTQTQKQPGSSSLWGGLFADNTPPQQPDSESAPPSASPPSRSSRPSSTSENSPSPGGNSQATTTAFRRENSEHLFPDRITREDGQQVINRVEDEIGNSFGDEFSEPVPGHGYLVGFEISLTRRHANSDPDVVSVQPLYRSKNSDKQGKGKLYGEKSDQVERAFAPKGYAVGAIRGKALGSVNGFELVYMKIKPDGSLDHNDTQISSWIGAESNSAFYSVIDGNGRPVTAVSGSIFMEHVHSMKLEFD